MITSSTPRSGWATLGKVLIVVGVAVVAVVGIAWAIGVRVELNGANLPALTTYNEEAHFAALETDRAAQPVDPVAAAPVAPNRRPEALWPAYRGTARDGRYRHPIRTDWPAGGLPRLWQQPVGGGYASFAAADGHLFTIEQRRDQEVVTAYDIETGRELWAHGWEALFRETMGGDGPRATPTWDDGRLFALGATGELHSLDAATGELRWRTNILNDAGATNLTWAMAASPLVVDGMVVVLPGGENGQSVVAYDADTGDLVWTALDDPQGYTAPMLLELAGVRQILVVTATRAVGLTVENGTLLWEYPWVTSSGPPNISMPVAIDGDRLFLSAGYGHGGALIEVTDSGGSLSAQEHWRTNRMKNRFSTSVLYEGHLYGLDESILACLDAETGELAWKGGRYGHGQLLLANGHLVVLTERGDVVLVRATPDGHEELARFEALSGKTWNNPAIVDGRLFVRNATEMAAFDIGP
jgi:outer membrane protein assembly factor BamB